LESPIFENLNFQKTTLNNSIFEKKSDWGKSKMRFNKKRVCVLKSVFLFNRFSHWDSPLFNMLSLDFNFPDELHPSSRFALVVVFKGVFSVC
jgi:hypothetical protein